MSARHTPGPWRLNREWFGDYLPGHVPVSAEKHGCLAQVVWKMEDDDRSPTCEANARLIAAAPELLAALIRLRGAESASRMEWTAALKNADDAIEKATGAA